MSCVGVSIKHLLQTTWALPVKDVKFGTLRSNVNVFPLTDNTL